ncbi:hypothetical protein ACR30L_16280 [Psychromonas sp. PT13]|uniref:hypothetical protein n=1 Tax=Psychromonas sp. PT13 TaxID=3439547 RepID=UPI003EC01E3A
MYAKVLVVTAGMGVPGTKLGITAMKYAYLAIQKVKGGEVQNYALDQFFEVGGKSSTLVMSTAITEWFKVNPKHEDFFSQRTNLLGKTIQIEIKGLLIPGVTTKVDVKVDVVNQYGESIASANGIDIPATGNQLGASSLRGKIVRLPSKKIAQEVKTAI